MNPWSGLLAVQALDTALAQLDHRLGLLPQRDELAAVEHELAAVGERSDHLGAAKLDLERSQQRLEDEIAGLRDKVAHANDQMYGGGITEPKQLQALSDEVASIERRIDVLEEQELALMEQIEPLEAELDELAGRRAELDQRAQDALAGLAEAEAGIEAERDALLVERASAVAEVGADALVRYESVRDRLGGVAVARLVSGSCGACHMKLSAVELDRIQHLAPDQPAQCEDCGRYLVRG